jgi:hypothetical protein
MLADDGTSGSTFAIEDCIFLPSMSGYGGDSATSNIATFVTSGATGVDNATLSVAHNTAYFSESGALKIGGGVTTNVGGLTAFQGNLCVGRSAVACHKIFDVANTIADTFAPEDVSNNAGYELVVGDESPGEGYDDFLFSGGGPHNVGVGDVDGVDPNYVDTSRYPWMWVDPTHTPLQGLDAAADRLSLGQSEYSILDLIEYIKTGWRPRADAMRGAGHADYGSRDIGAVQMAPGRLEAHAYALDRTEFTGHHPDMPPSVEAFLTAIEGNGSIAANLVSPRYHVVGDNLVIYFDAPLSGAEQSQVISEANSI